MKKIEYKINLLIEEIKEFKRTKKELNEDLMQHYTKFYSEQVKDVYFRSLNFRRNSVKQLIKQLHTVCKQAKIKLLYIKAKSSTKQQQRQKCNKVNVTRRT
ncbi:hypothetical protein MIJ3_00209 [Pseudomonas phage vB_PaeM_MIJ3]|nr:hypothetical protein MIJ3_00209 [Pseudomonas phage vB_PaeM_MIJ3]